MKYIDKVAKSNPRQAQTITINAGYICMSGYMGTQLCAPGNFIQTCKLRLSVENSDKHPEEIQNDN